MASAKKSLATNTATNNLTGNEAKPLAVDVAQGEEASTERSHERLVRILSKPDGEQASVIAALLGWQPHTLRAAISRLRRQGMQIATLRTGTAGAGELVYALRSQAMTGSEAVVDGAGQ